MTRVSTVQLLDFEATAEGDLVQWLTSANCSVAVSHTNKVLTIGRDAKGGLQVNHVLFDRVTGVCLTDGGDLLVASQHELWRLTDALSPGDLSPTGADRWLMCRVARFVGGVRLADPIAVGDDCWFASVALSAVCSLDDTFSAHVRWVPPFISAVRPEQRCRLTGLGARDGVPTVVTSASVADTPGGWSAHQRDGGVLIDFTTGEVLADGLSLPHSPRWHDGRWWLLQAGTGELGCVDGGRFEAVARIDGYARGLAIHNGVALIGASGSRWDELVAGLAVGDRLAASGERPDSGVFLVDLASGNRIGGLRLEGTAREVADVVVLPGARTVELSGPRSLIAQDWTTFPLDVLPQPGA